MLAIMITTAQADEWVRYAHTAAGVASEYNHSRITHHDNRGRVFVVWTRTDATMSRRELHCASASYRITDEITRDRDEVIWQLRDPEATWHYAVPEGTEMALIDRICHDYE